ncbi:isoleucine--tRNA ligase [Rhodomicrobium udaipurense JA643]|nr:isoleucine--tRNA ligase [Rhodomicrobium udaipurense JA643]
MTCGAHAALGYTMTKKDEAARPTKNGSAKDDASGNAKTADAAAQGGRDWSKTLFLPKTDFGMKAGLPNLEPKLLDRWEKMGLYKRLREDSAGREKFVLHDGPPYANGNIHIGTGLNKILKDAIVRSQQMQGKDANYVPGWDCHGLPIEWKVEEQYRAKGKNKDEVPVNSFRRQCREFAAKWIGVQMAEFKRLGVEGDWPNHYSTMAFEAEATIAGELMKFAMNGLLYRGSKPVMWSVVERTALAEAEVEYHEHASAAIYVKFPVAASLGKGELDGASIVIWTTTPWTIPANRAISYSRRIGYGLYEVTAAPEDNWTKVGERFILAKSLSENFFKAARVDEWTLIDDVDPAGLVAAHPFHASDGYEFSVPLLEGDHVTEDAGTGFVHTAPGHGADDFEIWMAKGREIAAAGIDTTVPDTVGPDGYYRAHVGLFGGAEPKRVVDDKGSFGKLDDTRYANAAVVEALKAAGALASMNPRHKHDYPHSWRSKAPVIFRNTPQWFIAMDKPVAVPGDVAGGEDATLRALALAAIDDTRFVPPQGRNRIGGMVADRPDWVISRQRAWGVPITVFVHKETGEVIPNAGFNGAAELQLRIVAAFAAEGADAWFADAAATRFLDGLVANPDEWEQVRDILDVWFDSGSTHAFVLEKRPDLKWPADLYLEGSDQHRGWFQSSLLESCGTRGRAPFDTVLTHGFVNDEQGRKMSKSLGNTVAPQDIIKQSGADILRLWALSSDYTEDLRIGPQIIQSAVDAYRKLRNTLRYVLGNLAHYEPGHDVAVAEMPELERYILHRVAEIDAELRAAYNAFDFRKAYRVLAEFCSNDLSAIYFDIRKDTLYCEAHSSPKRRASLTVLNTLFEALTAWLAPILPFTAEEAWLARHGADAEGSVHLSRFPAIPAAWRDDALGEKWEKIFAVRRVITGALEIERREKRIGSSLEAAPDIYIGNKELAAVAKAADWAEIAITSGFAIKSGDAPEDAFTLDEVEGVAVVPKRAEGRKCARSWRITDDVGSDPAYPELSARDAAAVREFDARGA